MFSFHLIAPQALHLGGILIMGYGEAIHTPPMLVTLVTYIVYRLVLHYFELIDPYSHCHVLQFEKLQIILPS